MRESHALIGTEQLAAVIGRPDLRIYDCTTCLEPPPPGSVNAPAATLVVPTTKGFTPIEDARATFAARGVTGGKRVIAHRGGGISATVDLFVPRQLGYDGLALHDDSMGEWAEDPSLPIETD